VPDQSLKPETSLTAGFTNIGRFRLVEGVTEGKATPVFQWEVPKDAWTVVCALFGCLPEVEGRNGGPERIVNYDECVIAEDIYRLDPDAPESTPFSVLGDTGNGFVSPGDARCASLDDRPASQVRKLTALAVGCWAYSDTKLIAATRLAHLTPGDTGSYNAQIPKTARCGADFTPCYESEKSFFGTCHDGVCQPRCTEDADCLPQLTPGMTPAGSGGAGGEAAGTAGAGGETEALARCGREHASDFVGVCVMPTGTGGTGN
jgi:hypothetical protein